MVKVLAEFIWNCTLNSNVQGVVLIQYSMILSLILIDKQMIVCYNNNNLRGRSGVYEKICNACRKK